MSLSVGGGGDGKRKHCCHQTAQTLAAAGTGAHFPAGRERNGRSQHGNGFGASSEPHPALPGVRGSLGPASGPASAPELRAPGSPAAPEEESGVRPRRVLSCLRSTTLPCATGTAVESIVPSGLRRGETNAATSPVCGVAPAAHGERHAGRSLRGRGVRAHDR